MEFWKNIDYICAVLNVESMTNLAIKSGNVVSALFMGLKQRKRLPERDKSSSAAALF